MLLCAMLIACASPRVGVGGYPVDLRRIDLQLRLRGATRIVIGRDKRARPCEAGANRADRRFVVWTIDDCRARSLRYGLSRLRHVCGSSATSRGLEDRDAIRTISIGMRTAWPARGARARLGPSSLNGPPTSRLTHAVIRGRGAAPTAHSGASGRLFQRHPVSHSEVSGHPEMTPLSVVT